MSTRPETPKRPDNVVWTSDDQPEPVSPEHPLEGLETRVLAVWLENSKNVRQAHKRTRSQWKTPSAKPSGPR